MKYFLPGFVPRSCEHLIRVIGFLKEELIENKALFLRRIFLYVVFPLDRWTYDMNRIGRKYQSIDGSIMLTYL